MKYILFIRHAETMKNVKKEFSKEGKKDRLTNVGEKQVQKLVALINKFIVQNISIKYIYTSTSYRSIATGKILSQKFKLPIKIIAGLNSFDLGQIGGLSEKKTKLLYPIFYSQLKLYRKGLLNSYEINYPKDAEKPLDFEKRIRDGINKILVDKSEDIKIIVLHRSALTAAYIEFSRRYYNYPIDFYGFVPIENGEYTFIKYYKNRWEFSDANEIIR